MVKRGRELSWILGTCWVVDLQWCILCHLVIAPVCLSCLVLFEQQKTCDNATARARPARTSLVAVRGAAVAPETGRTYFCYLLGLDINIPSTRQDCLNTNIPHPTPTMKITINSFRAVATWKWDLPEESDDTCGICRVNFEGTCSKCKFPGDDCPIIVGECRHCFHMVCLAHVW